MDNQEATSSRKRSKLTQYQQRQIREARLRGAGYRAIANVFGLDRDVVRNFCVRQGLDSGATEKTTAPRLATCISCGRSLKQPHTGRPRKFCSVECRRAWWSSHRDAIEKSESAMYSTVCAACGTVFVAYGNRHRKYCCPECYYRDRFGSRDDNSMIKESESY